MTLVTAAVLHVTGMFDLVWLIAHFRELLTASMIWGFVVTFLVRVFFYIFFISCEMFSPQVFILAVTDVFCFNLERDCYSHVGKFFL